jgi:hypothetical protein
MKISAKKINDLVDVWLTESVPRQMFFDGQDVADHFVSDKNSEEWLRVCMIANRRMNEYFGEDDLYLPV